MSCGCGPDLYSETSSGGLTVGGSAVFRGGTERTSGGVTSAGTAAVSTNRPWDDYAQVFHLHEEGNGTTGEYRDSVGGEGGTAGSATNAPARIPGVFRYAQEFDGNDFIVLPTDTLPQVTDLTVSLWVKTTSTFLDRVFYSRGRTDTEAGTGYSVEIGHDGSRRPYASVQVIDADGRWQVRTATGATALSSGCWYHLALVWGGGVSLKLYVDGSPVATKLVTEDRLVPSGGRSAVGRRENYKNMIGAASGLRISGDRKSQQFIKALHDSVCVPGFYTSTLTTPTYS